MEIQKSIEETAPLEQTFRCVEACDKNLRFTHNYFSTSQHSLMPRDIPSAHDSPHEEQWEFVRKGPASPAAWILPKTTTLIWARPVPSCLSFRTDGECISRGSECTKGTHTPLAACWTGQWENLTGRCFHGPASTPHTLHASHTHIRTQWPAPCAAKGAERKSLQTFTEQAQKAIGTS